MEVIVSLRKRESTIWPVFNPVNYRGSPGLCNAMKTRGTNLGVVLSSCCLCTIWSFRLRTQSEHPRCSGKTSPWPKTCTGFDQVVSVRRRNVMTYVMTKPCPVCKQQLTKKVPTDTVQCACGKHVWQG